MRGQQQGYGGYGGMGGMGGYGGMGMMGGGMGPGMMRDRIDARYGGPMMGTSG